MRRTPGHFGGLWIDRDAFGTIVLAFTDDPAPLRTALAERRLSADDVAAVEPPPEITDDRPIGEWDVAFDVVQVLHTEADLVAAIEPSIEAAQAVTGSPVGGGSDVLRNRVGIDLSAPVTAAEFTVIADAIVALDGVSLDMVCWSGQFADEAPDPIEPGTPLDAIQQPDDDGTYPPGTPVTCDGLQFELGDLEALTAAEDVEPGLRSVLDGWLANPEGRYWPQDGWVLLNADEERAAFIRISDDGVSYVGAEMGNNGWIWAGAGGSGICDVRLMLPSGVGDVEWLLDPDAPAPDPTSTEIRLLATERGCASGQDMGDRLLGPQVVETSNAVLIAFGVIPQPGAQKCPGNPSTPVVVNLGAPLGDREIPRRHGDRTDHLTTRRTHNGSRAAQATSTHSGITPLPVCQSACKIPNGSGQRSIAIPSTARGLVRRWILLRATACMERAISVATNEGTQGCITGGILAGCEVSTPRRCE